MILKVVAICSISHSAFPHTRDPLSPYLHCEPSQDYTVSEGDVVSASASCSSAVPLAGLPDSGCCKAAIEYELSMSNAFLAPRYRGASRISAHVYGWGVGFRTPNFTSRV
jgi:hypothetical protein